MTSRPNVVLVVLDTARADALEPYGAKAGATPVLADAARAGAAPEHVFATANWTLPSHVSMLSGQMPREAGLGQAPSGRSDLCAPYLQQLEPSLLPAVLRGAGYRTRGVSANLWITSWSGFGTGFDEFVDIRHGRSTPGSSWKGQLRWAAEAVRARADDGARQAERVIGRWLGEVDESPFFWFVNLVECHSPYLPPRPYAALGPAGRLLAAREAEEHLTLIGMWGASAGSHTVPEPALDRMRRQYAGAVRQLDDWIGRLLGRLEDAGILDDTIVIVTSDHGENLGESGRLGHSFWLDDRLVRVPLVWLGPRPRFSEVVSLADLPGLVADAIGLDPHPWASAADRGVAVATNDALLDATDPRMARARDAFGFDDFATWRMTTASTSATDGALKLVREGDEDWLYDLATDPSETAPVHVDGRVAATYGERFHRLRRAVDSAHVSGTVQVRPTGDRPAADVPDDLEERMRLLGYL